jgi:hypothetical protein
LVDICLRLDVQSPVGVGIGFTMVQPDGLVKFRDGVSPMSGGGKVGSRDVMLRGFLRTPTTGNKNRKSNQDRRDQTRFSFKNHG